MRILPTKARLATRRVGVVFLMLLLLLPLLIVSVPPLVGAVYFRPRAPCCLDALHSL